MYVIRELPLCALLIYVNTYIGCDMMMMMMMIIIIMGRHPVAVDILHITYAWTMKVDYSRFSWEGYMGSK
jgi:hypothetical protein